MLPKRGRSRGGGGENCGRGELTDSSKLDQTPKNTEITCKQLEQQSIKLFTISPLILLSHNRNILVKIGRQIDAMHVFAEKANQISNPTQCFKCMRFGHVAKRCNARNSICANCGDKHSTEQYFNLNQKLCLYKQQQKQRIQQTIERYTTTISKPPPTAPNINDNEDFPSLTKTNLNYSSNMHIQIKDVLKEKMLEIIEQITQRI
ncbi:unnamed protein product [Rotaria magnacalcarata]|uniref:CCHC-type domain-containing protein n=1 Tax=Rotaria magnacalcarata TaxID=392030 RepID=A0A8S2JHV4_9BILA|nr:unnamed protein product [Rotaria magnacalcarata]CAF3811789.1 unnamed protein product [Rotaria magnacalcarata]